MAYRNTVVVAELWDSDCQYYRHTKTRKTTIRDLFTGLFIKTYPQYLKNLKKLIFVFLQTKDFSVISFVMILRPISLNKIYLEITLQRIACVVECRNRLQRDKLRGQSVRYHQLQRKELDAKNVSIFGRRVKYYI